MQTTVQQTVDAVLTPCEEQLHQWQDEPFAEEREVKGLNSAQPLTRAAVAQMEGKLNEAKEILVGVRNLYKSLKWQYSKYTPDTPQRQAISALKETLTASSKKMIADSLLLEHVKSKLQNQEAGIRETSSKENAVRTSIFAQHGKS